MNYINQSQYLNLRLTKLHSEFAGGLEYFHCAVRRYTVKSDFHKGWP